MTLWLEKILESLSTENRALLENTLKETDVALPKEFNSIWTSAQQEFLQTSELNPTEVAEIKTELSATWAWRRLHLQQHLKSLPYPLSRKSIDFVQQRIQIEEGEDFPQFAYLLTATTSLLVRQWAICTIQTYLTVFQGNDPTINVSIVRTLRSPTDNQWWQLTQELVQWMRKKGNVKTLKPHKLHAFIECLHTTITQKINLTENERLIEESTYAKKPLSKLKSLGQGLKHLLDFRNALIHAHRLEDSDITHASTVLESVLQGLIPMNRFHLACKVGNTEYLLQGLFPTEVNSTSWVNQVEDKELVLLVDGQTFLCPISPLMSLAQDLDTLSVDNDVFFINAGSISLLKYVGFVNGEHKDGKSLGSYDQFKRYMASIPVPVGTTDQPLIDFTNFVTDKTKNFVGRTEVLQEIEDCVQQRGGQYCFLKALAGMGKSAIMARLYQLHPYKTEEGKRTSGDIWLYHYCMQSEGRDQPITALRSLLTQLNFACKGQEGKRPSMKVDELKQEFQTTLNSSSSLKALQRREGEKIVVVLDALDEASFTGDDSILTCIPEHLADHVVFICSYRVNAQCQNQRVEAHLKHLPQDKVYTLESAHPLRGLTKDNVQTFVEHLSPNIPNQEATLTHLWNAASMDLDDAADPFYLRFVADGVEKRQYFLTHPETIPTSLNGAFEKMWLSLPADRNFLAHRLLVTLGIMRDLGDDELFAELFSRQFPTQTFTIDDIAQIRRPIGKLLAYDGERYGLFHDRFKYFLVGEQPDPIEEALRAQDENTNT